MSGITILPEGYSRPENRTPSGRNTAIFVAPHEFLVASDVMDWRRYIQHIKTIGWKDTIFTTEDIRHQLTDECEHDDHHRHIAVTYEGEVDESVVVSINHHLKTTTGRWEDDGTQGSYLVWAEKVERPAVPNESWRTMSVWEVKFGRVVDVEPSANTASQISSPSLPPQ